MDDNRPYKIQIIPDEDRITLDKISTFEMGQIISHRISQIGKDSVVYLPDEYRYVDASRFDPAIKKNIPAENVVKNGNGSFVKLVTTADIVYGEINTGNIPYAICRTISTDHNKRIIWVEIIDPNTTPREILKYYSNYSI